MNSVLEKENHEDILNGEGIELVIIRDGWQYHLFRYENGLCQANEQISSTRAEMIVGFYENGRMPNGSTLNFYSDKARHWTWVTKVVN